MDKKDNTKYIIKAIQVKGFVRNVKGKMERVNPFSKKGNKALKPIPKVRGKQIEPIPKPRINLAESKVNQTPKDYGEPEKDYGAEKITTADNWEQAQKFVKQNVDSVRIKEPKMNTATDFTDAYENAHKELRSVSGYLAGDTALLANDVINVAKHFVRGNKDDFKDIKPEDMNALFMDMVDKMVHQEIESNREQFTDHGIRHIGKNISAQQKFLDALEQSGMKISPKERLLSVFIMVNHDMGYANEEVKNMKKNHKEVSTDIIKEQKSSWDVGKIFTEEEFDKAVDIIRTHDSPDLLYKGKFDPLAATTRLTDNLCLFQEDKLPSMFQYVEGGKDSLVKLGEAAKDKNEEAFNAARKELWDKIDAAPNLGKNLKRDLKAGTNRINFMTPKFALGALAGEVEKIGKGKNSMLQVSIKHNEFDAFLQKYFDMGQESVKKMLKEYGIEPPYNKSSYKIGEYEGKPILELKVK